MHKSDTECLYEAYRQIYKEDLVNTANKAVIGAVKHVIPPLGAALQRDRDIHDKGEFAVPTPNETSSEHEIESYLQHANFAETILDQDHINYLQNLAKSNANLTIRSRAQTALNKQTRLRADAAKTAK